MPVGCTRRCTCRRVHGTPDVGSVIRLQRMGPNSHAEPADHLGGQVGQADRGGGGRVAHSPADVVTPWYAAVHAHDVVVPRAEALACIVAQGKVEKQATPLRHEVPVHLTKATPRVTREAGQPTCASCRYIHPCRLHRASLWLGASMKLYVVSTCIHHDPSRLQQAWNSINLLDHPKTQIWQLRN